jgi:hypothetical protein
MYQTIVEELLTLMNNEQNFTVTVLETLSSLSLRKELQVFQFCQRMLSIALKFTS